MSSRPHVALLIETSNAYARGLLRGVHAYLREHRPWSIYLPEQGRGAAPPEWLQRWNGDGIIARIENQPIARAIKERKLPTVDVSAWRFLPEWPCVETDNESIAAMAFEHLRDNGFESFAFCGDDRFQWSRERRDSFARLAAEAGCECSLFPPPRTRAAAAHGETEEQGIAAWVAELPKPCGVMACYDIRGWQLLEACREVGVTAPDQVAVVGVDNDELLCNLSEPPLSSVIPDADRAGYKAAALLDRLMAGEAISGLHLLKPTGLVVRQSSDVLAVDDPDVSRAVRYIRDHAIEGIKVADLLRAVPVSRRMLEARFKKLLGHSPHDEILRVQLRRVRLLLEETDLPLKMIADRAGFKHVEYLGAVFKRHFGQAPGEFRDRHRNKPPRSA